MIKMNEPTSGILIFAKDHRSLAEFYSRLLGAEETDNKEGYITLFHGGVELIIHALHKAIADSISINEPPEQRSDIAIKPIFFVESIEQCRSIVSGTKARLNDKDLEFRFYDYVVCDGTDPEGNVFQIRSKQTAAD